MIAVSEHKNEMVLRVRVIFLDLVFKEAYLTVWGHSGFKKCDRGAETGAEGWSVLFKS